LNFHSAATFFGKQTNSPRETSSTIYFDSKSPTGLSFCDRNIILLLLQYRSTFLHRCRWNQY